MWFLLAAIALAETPFPSYRDATGRAAWIEIDELIEAGRYDDALTEADKFERSVMTTAGIAYLRGLAWRGKGDPKRAETELLRAIALDPDYESPWYDLGEIQMVQGRYDEAEKAFAEVARLTKDTPRAMIGPWRLAECAAAQHDPAGFEEHIREALRSGFSFRQIAGLPNWQAYYADPAMRDSIEKMITVYGDRDVLTTLEGAPAPP